MNDTTQRLLQNLLQYGCGALVAHGVIKGSQAEDLASALLGILVYAWAHFHFKKAVNTALDGPPPAKTPGRLSSLLFLFLALSCAVEVCGVGALLTGCKNPGAAAYSAVNVTTVSAQEALKGWNAYVVANHPPASQSLAVRNAYAKFQAAELAAFDAAQIVSDVASSTNSTIPALEAEARTQAAAQALTDLVALVRSFGVNL